MASSPRANIADLKTALAQAERLLNREPRQAGQQAEEILEAHPGSEPAQRILAAAFRRQANPSASLMLLAPLVKRNGGSPSFLFEFGQTLGAVGRGAEAIAALRRAVQLDPGHAAAWRALGDQLAVAGDEAGSHEAYEKHLAATIRHPELLECVNLLRDGKLALAERLARDFLKQHPADVSAIRILADIGMKLGQYEDARKLLERCLELAPDFHLARSSYAITLVRLQSLEAAYGEVQKLLLREPDNPNFLILKGTILMRMGQHPEALEIYERILRHYPNQARAQMNYGHTLKTVGRLGGHRGVRRDRLLFVVF